MNQLNYTTFAALVADFNAGAKFEVRGINRHRVNEIVLTDGGIRVTTTLTTYRAFQLDGSNSIHNGLRLVKVAEAPQKHETSFPFSSYDALIAAFDAGVKFQVRTSAGAQPVTDISRYGNRVSVVVGSGPYTEFKLDGTNDHVRAKLEVVPDPSIQVGGSISFAPAAVPMLKRFLAGEPFHNPKTGEVLHEVSFKNGELIVVLKDPETGAFRSTPRYNHEGKHKYRAERSLVPGNPPPKKKSVNVKVYKHAYNGSLFVIREGEVIPNIRGINNAKLVGETTITE